MANTRIKLPKFEFCKLHAKVLLPTLPLFSSVAAPMTSGSTLLLLIVVLFCSSMLPSLDGLRRLPFSHGGLNSTLSKALTAYFSCWSTARIPCQCRRSKLSFPFLFLSENIQQTLLHRQRRGCTPAPATNKIRSPSCSLSYASLTLSCRSPSSSLLSPKNPMLTFPSPVNHRRHGSLPDGTSFTAPISSPSRKLHPLALAAFSASSPTSLSAQDTKLSAPHWSTLKIPPSEFPSLNSSLLILQPRKRLAPATTRYASLRWLLPPSSPSSCRSNRNLLVDRPIPSLYRGRFCWHLSILPSPWPNCVTFQVPHAQD